MCLCSYGKVDGQMGWIQENMLCCVSAYSSALTLHPSMVLSSSYHDGSRFIFLLANSYHCRLTVLTGHFSFLVEPLPICCFRTAVVVAATVRVFICLDTLLVHKLQPFRSISC